jgi:DNA-binding MarR family transcriptional regulator
MASASPVDGDDELVVAMQGIIRLMGSRRVSSRVARAAGAPVSQQGMEILRGLRRGGAQGIAQLARAAHMDVSAVSRQLRVLERDGLVRRSSDSLDGRVARISPTRGGRLLAERIARVSRQHLDDALADWSPDDRDRLAGLLARMVHDLRTTEIRPVGETLAR